MTENQEVRHYAHMDWLTKSYGFARHPGEILPTNFKPFYVEGDTSPMPHYQRAWKLRCGGTLNLSRDMRQGARIDLTGQALAYIREYGGQTDEEIVQMLAKSEKHKRTTRLDYCFNAYGEGAVKDVWDYVQEGNYKGALKVAPSIATPGKIEGQTVYFGSKTSDFRVRAYDKGAEMGMLSVAWARVEAQFRGEYAQNACSDIARGISLAVHTRSKIAKSCGDLRIGWWQRALEGQTAEITGLQRKDVKFMNRMKQLLEEIIKKARENSEQLDYIEHEWLPVLAEKVMAARRHDKRVDMGDVQDVKLPVVKGRINEDWTITYSMGYDES